ncbi:MAG: hypothetical protein RLZZ410_1609 [Pseudomonadota bacterium]|jgi:hypothetical protein
MKIRYISICTLISSIFFSTAVNAEWTFVSEGTDVIQYIDIDRIKRNGKSVKVWTLYDIKKSVKPHKSAIMLREFDCRDDKDRTLQVTFYSGQMGTGSPVKSFSDIDEWSYVTPGSVSYTLMDLVCIVTK